MAHAKTRFSSFKTRDNGRAGPASGGGSGGGGSGDGGGWVVVVVEAVSRLQKPLPRSLFLALFSNSLS